MKFRNAFVIVIVTFILASCEKAPTSLGSDLLPPEDFINMISANSSTENWEQSSKSFTGQGFNLGRSKLIFLGKHNGVSADLLIRHLVIIPDSVFSALQADSITVLSAWMEFNPVYTWGDSNSTLKFTVHNINATWQHNFFDSDSLQNLDYSPINLASQITESDSLLTFNLDQSEVLRWLKERVDTSLPKENFGLLLAPDDNNNKIVGFPSTSGLEFGNIPKLNIVVEKTGEFIDTLSTTIIQDDAHVVQGSITPASDDKILLQNGVLGRGFLKFDFSSIEKKSIINQSQLTVHIDEALSEFGNPSSDSIEVALFIDSLNLQTVDSTIAPVYLLRNGDIYSGDITILLQMLLNSQENLGFRLRLSDEERSFDKIILYGSSAAAEANKPKITLTYTAF